MLFFQFVTWHFLIEVAMLHCVITAWSFIKEYLFDADQSGTVSFGLLSQ